MRRFRWTWLAVPVFVAAALAGRPVEVHGDGGTPPYLVKFDDGKTRLIYPGPDAVIQHPAS